MEAKKVDWEKLPQSIRDIFRELSSDVFSYMDFYKVEFSNAFFAFIAIALKDTPFGKKNSRLVGLVTNGVFSDIFVKSYPLGSEKIIQNIYVMLNLAKLLTKDELKQKMSEKGYLHLRLSSIV